MLAYNIMGFPIFILKFTLGKGVRLPWPPVICKQSFLSVSTNILGNKLMDSNIRMEFQTVKRSKALTALAYQ